MVDETFPHCLGNASEPDVREAIETSDGPLSIGCRPIEVITDDFTASLPANTIRACGHSVVGDDNYQAVTLRKSSAPSPTRPRTSRIAPYAMSR